MMLTKQLRLACLLSLCFTVGANAIGNDSTFILVKVLNNSTRNNYFISYSENGTYFSRYSYSTSGKNINSGPFYRLSADYPLKFSVFANVRGIIEGIALPGDTTVVELDYSRPEDPARFSGKSAEVCEFYMVANKVVQKFYTRAYNSNTSDSYINYFIFLEEKHQRIDSFYNAYNATKKLPDWFEIYFKTNIIYEKALAMMENIHTINYNTRTKVYPTPEFLLWFRDVPVDNPSAIKNQLYFDFLWQYFLWKNNIIWNRTSGGKIYTEWFSKVLPSINRELKDPVKEWFLKELLVNFYAAKDLDEVDSAFSIATPFLKNKGYLDEITRARNKAFEIRERRFAGAAKVGSKAPRFHLTDTMNNKVTLDKFYGRWLFLRFIKSGSLSSVAINADFLNDSVTFNPERVHLVNVFTDSDKGGWEKELVKYPYSGYHLFCKGNWGEILTYQYGLRSFPYWVLVDPQGIIQYSGIPDYNAVFGILKNK